VTCLTITEDGRRALLGDTGHRLLARARAGLGAPFRRAGYPTQPARPTHGRGYISLLLTVPLTAIAACSTSLMPSLMSFFHGYYHRIYGKNV
jgi:hypothetical protein